MSKYILELEDGKQIKLEEIKEEEKETYSEKMQDDLEPID